MVQCLAQHKTVSSRMLWTCFFGFGVQVLCGFDEGASKVVEGLDAGRCGLLFGSC